MTTGNILNNEFHRRLLDAVDDNGGLATSPRIPRIHRDSEFTTERVAQHNTNTTTQETLEQYIKAYVRSVFDGYPTQCMVEQGDMVIAKAQIIPTIQEINQETPIEDIGIREDTLEFEDTLNTINLPQINNQINRLSVRYYTRAKTCCCCITTKKSELKNIEFVFNLYIAQSPTSTNRSEDLRDSSVKITGAGGEYEDLL